MHPFAASTARVSRSLHPEFTVSACQLNHNPQPQRRGPRCLRLSMGCKISSPTREPSEGWRRHCRRRKAYHRRVSSFDRARDAVYFVTATIDSLAGVVENAIFSVNLVDGGAPASWIVFTEDITKIADQQGRYAVWHVLSPLGIECGLRYLGPERLYPLYDPACLLKAQARTSRMELARIPVAEIAKEV